MPNLNHLLAVAARLSIGLLQNLAQAASSLPSLASKLFTARAAPSSLDTIQSDRPATPHVGDAGVVPFLPAKNRRVFGYVRAQRSAQSNSLERQALGCAAYASELGLSVTHIFQDVASGLTRHQAGLQALLRELRPTDIVVVQDLDRLSRDLRCLLEIRQQLEDQGIELHSTEVGKLTAVHLAFHLMIREQVRAHMRQRLGQPEKRRVKQRRKQASAKTSP